MPDRSGPPTVALVTLGCARNEVDSEELAARLADGGFELVAEPERAETVLVNTCGFVETAKKDSVDQLLAASDLKETGKARSVIAVGCMAERYGKELADALPEADAVLSFDDYPEIADRVRSLLDGGEHSPHVPTDRRKLLPLSPAERPAAGAAVPGHGAGGAPANRGQAPGGWAGKAPSREGVAPDLPAGLAPASGPRVYRRRLGGGPYAPLKLASGCDRRCTFCAIPRFRGAFLSRPPEDLAAEAGWLAGQGVRELFLVSENSTSYGKDLGDLRLLENHLLPELAAVDGIERVRVSYLQPAEVRPGLIEVMTGTEGVAPYFDLSFQHASGPVLRRMRRFGDNERFLGLIEQIRARAPHAGIRSNVIVGFPGETEADLDELCGFLEAAALDVVGVFGYSDEDGTEAAGFDGKLDEDEIAARVQRVSELAEELNAQRAEDRIGERVTVLVESAGAETGTRAGAGTGRRAGTGAGEERANDRAAEETSGGLPEGRAAHQGPEVDGSTYLLDASGARVGDLITAKVVSAEGADLIARVVP